ncbi:MAG: HAD family hydrolase, partial [Candidatus Heimdallarchaeota archaeon]
MSIIFDVDGTLLNTQEKKSIAYEKIIEYLNSNFNKHITIEKFWSIVRIQFEIYSDYRKNDLEIRLRILRAFYDLDKKEFNEILPNLLSIYWNSLKNGTIYPQIKDIIKKIRKENITFYLFSDCSIDEMEFKLNLFPNNFLPDKIIAFVTDHRKSKHKNIISLGKNKIPETYRFLLKNYQTKIMIG